MSNNDIETLKTIAHKNDTAVKLFTFFALKTRDAKDGVLNTLKELRRLRKAGETIDEEKYMEAFKDLESAGYGKTYKGKAGRVVKFKFKHPVYQIGKAAIEGMPLQADHGRPVKRPAVAPRGSKVSRPKLEPVTAPMVQPPAIRQVVDASRVHKTIVYCFVNGQRIKMEIEGNADQATIDRVIESVQPKVGLA